MRPGMLDHSVCAVAIAVVQFVAIRYWAFAGGR